MEKQHTDTFEPSGVLLVNKHAGVTSHDVVGKIRRLYNTKRVGHTGTLDPMATGVLVVLVGRAAKASEYLASDRKSYRATLRLGITTDTEDMTGTILTTTNVLPSPNEVEAIRPRFIGKILQTPPMYSALKVNGKKLVDLAREGITVEREARPVTIHEIKATPTSDPRDYTLSITCSSGTYIRTLCADIGNDLGCGGVMASLHRTNTGSFSIDECHTPEELEALSPAEREALLLPIEDLFSDLFAVPLPAFFERLARSGCEIYQKKIATDYPVGTRLRVCDEAGAFFALGEVQEYENGTAIKLIKTFVL
jgi:tRNA pseudouridine55 synthase